MSNALLIIDPQNKQLIYKGTQSLISIGRVDSNDFFVQHDTVSRSHAEFRKVGQDWVVVDLGSTNGTFLNANQVLPQMPLLLRAGDSLRFGDIETVVSEEGNIRSVPSLYVFKKATYQGEFPISSTTDFSFGGMNATIPSDELSTNDLIFIIRQDESGLLMSCKHPQITPLHNGEDVSGRVLLTDRDIIQIGSLYVLISHRNLSEVGEVVSRLNSEFEGQERHKTQDTELELPEYLKSRMGDEGWDDPMKKKRKRTATVFSLEQFTEETEQRRGSTLRSQSELVGVQRFSMPNLAAVKIDEEKRIKKHAIIGVATIFVVLIMVLVLFDLYRDFFVA